MTNKDWGGGAPARAVSSSSLRPRGVGRRECWLDSDLPKVMGRVETSTPTVLLQKSHIRGVVLPLWVRGKRLAFGLRPDSLVQTVLSYTVNRSLKGT